MIRKLLTSVLCVLLALSLPLCALAATEYTLTAVPGDELAAIAPVKDMFDVLAIRLMGGEQSGMLTIALGEQDVLSLAVRADADGIYVDSASLADKPLYFAKEDVKTYLEKAMRESGQIPEENIAAITQSVDQAFVSLGVASAATQSGSTVELTQEEALEQIKAQFAKDPALVDYIVGIIEKATITDGEFTDAAHDPATQKVEINITQEDLVKLADSTTMQSMMKSSGGEEMTPENLKKALESMEYSMPITVLTADEGNTLVSIAAPLTMKGTVESTKTENGKTETENVAVDIAMDMAYNRLTVEGQVKHSASIVAKESGEAKMNGLLTITDDGKGAYALDGTIGIVEDGEAKNVMTVQGALNKGETGSEGWLGMLADDTQITLGYSSAKTDEGKQKSISIYTRSDAAAILAPAAADRPMITLNLNIKEVGEEALTAINGATADSALNLLALTAEEQETALSDILTHLQQTLFTAMGAMPPSVMELFMATGETAK